VQGVKSLHAARLQATGSIANTGLSVKSYIS
jgi:hypothetical protein